MQAHTRLDGYNLIVCPVETENMPYDELPFDCFLKPGELSGYYADWEILKYNENRDICTALMRQATGSD